MSDITTANIAADTPPQLLQFIEHKLNTLAKWDLIQFFHRKPSLVGPAPKIASLTGRDLRQVESELREMASEGLLDAQKKSGVVVYSLSGNPEVQSMVTQFIHACDNRQFREAAIYHTVSRR
jgi:hypothetical protein